MEVKKKMQLNEKKNDSQSLKVSKILE